jgi:DNA-binding response OmpR family regulator
MRMLVIEDSRFLRLAIERALTKAGHTVSTAKDGVEGVRAVREIIPDLVLLDMMLPRLSGLEVLRALKRDAATKDVPVIVLTGLSERNKEKLLNEGASGYVEKSETLLQNNSAALIDAIVRVIGKATSAKA